MNHAPGIVEDLRVGCSEGLPRISPVLRSLFERYTRGYIARNFSSLFVTHPLPRFNRSAGPYIVFLNHASWWDPLVCLLLASRVASGLANFAPIDCRMLEKFRFFRKLGFFGIEKNSRRGAFEFLRTSQAILRQPNAVLWVTPQGEFVDQRVRPAELKSGIALLARSVPNLKLVPLALDYSFGAERLPTVGAKFGSVISSHDSTLLSRSGWAELLRLALEQTQDELAADVLSGDVKHRSALVAGRTGAGGIYGLWQLWRGTRC